jgi:pSer/pThr/pTyr-binding forkhead associated (FHA) protein/tetratricopeptide (TPR) repeat protein
MTENDKGQGSGDLPEDGWSADDRGAFASEHTTVDPTLLARLAELDAKSKAAASSGDVSSEKMPREKTITLDISDLLDMEEEEEEEEEESGEALSSADEAEDDDAAPEDQAARTEAFDASELMAALGAKDAAEIPAPKSPDISPEPKTEAYDAESLLAGAALEALAAEEMQAKQSEDEPGHDERPDADDTAEQPGASASDGPIMGGAAVLGGVSEENRSAVGPALSGSSTVEKTKDPEPEESVLPEIDPEFASEKTQIFLTAMDDEPTRAKLHIVQGGGQQKEYLLARDRLTIGRGTNNDILVPDIAISRQHCEITRKADGMFRLRDLQSGNGTKLNGTRVLDADLFGGDRIEIGSTVMEFVITGSGASRSPGERKINYHPSEPAPRKPAAPAPRATEAVPNYSGGSGATQTHFSMAQPAPAPSGSSAWIWLALAAVGLLFLSLAVVLGTKIYIDTEASRPGVAGKSATEYYHEGLTLAQGRHWDKAEEKFSFAIEIASDERAFDVRKDATLKLEWVRQEKKNQKAIDRGRVLLKRGDYLEAITQLDTVRSGSPYYDDARTLIPEAREKYAGQLVDQAHTDFKAKQYEQSDRKITLALITRPDYQPALELRKRIDTLPKETYKRPPTVARATPRTPRKRGANTKGKGKDKGVAVASNAGDKNKDSATDKDPTSKKDPDAGKKGTSGVADFTVGLTLYRNGRYAQAIAYFDRLSSETDDRFSAKRAKVLSSKVKQFETRYTGGSAAYAAGNHSQATRALTNALNLDRAISKGYYGPEIKGKLAESHYKLGRAAFNGSNFQLAGSNAKKVLKYKRSHEANRQLLAQLETKGRALYVDARAAKTTDPVRAKRICETIIQMLPSSSETHQKAAKLRKEL